MINIYQNTQCNVPEDSYLYIRRRENLKSHRINTRLTAGFTAPCYVGIYTLLYEHFSSDIIRDQEFNEYRHFQVHNVQTLSSMWRSPT
jgi:uncharacterized protein YcgL (UPF0745 family)